jgi:hypothetical protein
VDAGEPPRGTETVLLVEDEASVRELAARVLRGQGYTVLEAADGGQALRELTDPGRVIDLLLTDVVLRGIGGKELAQRVTALRPGLPVLFMSGYANPVLTQHGVLEPGLTLLEKPFTATTLARKVRDVIDGRP